MLAQVALGISNVVYSLPLWVAVAHNAGAALLLFVVVGLLARLRDDPDPEVRRLAQARLDEAQQ